MVEHRSGINPGFLARHKLRLKNLDAAKTKAIVAEIDALYGVDRVWLNERNQTLKIAYDAAHHDIDEMIAIVEKHGGKIKDNGWSRMRLGWQRQVDQNVRDNYHHEAACCSKPPPRILTKK